MERLYSKQKSGNVLLNRIIGSVSSALEGLSLRDDGSPGKGSDDDGSASAYSHGDPRKALHSSLAELFTLPFPCICFVAIDGEEMMYCNRAFELNYFSDEEANRRLETGSPRDIMSRYVTCSNNSNKDIGKASGWDCVSDKPPCSLGVGMEHTASSIPGRTNGLTD